MCSSRDSTIGRIPYETLVGKCNKIVHRGIEIMANEDNLIILTLFFPLKMLLLHCVLVGLERKNLIKEHPFAYVRDTVSRMHCYTNCCDVR